MPILILLLLGGVTVATLADRRAAERARLDALRGGPAPGPASSSTAVAVGPGGTWEAVAGVIVPVDLVPHLDALAARVGGHLVITSGYRSPSAQARAMISKVQQGGPQELGIYADKAAIAELLALPLDVDAWAAKIGEWTAAGRYLSRHMRGRAVDVRTRDVPMSRTIAVQGAAQALGWRTLLEGVPPHLHLER